ncbi:MAG: phage portal protein, partial [Dehalococcoidia bacterium]
MTISRKAMAARRDASNSANARALRAVVIPITKAAGPEPGKSKAVSEDAFAALAKTGRVVSPPFDLLTLAMVNEHNSEMTPVVDAMATNIEGFGYGFKLAVGLRDASDELKREVARERVRLTNFFNNANLRDSFIKLRRKMRRDLELTGNAYLEVIRNAAGQIQGFAHLPSYQVRLGLLEDDPVKIAVPIIELQEDGSRKIVEVGTWERFRTFAQSRLTPFQGLHVSEGGVLLRWFKEFGDPRVYDNRVGEAVPAEKVANWDGSGGAMPEELRANEVVHFSLYSCRSPYGLPRYIGNLLSIFGARAAEEINYLTFTNNNIPSMLLLVANGQITQGSLDRIKAFAESTIQGSDNYSKFLIIEAEGDLEGEDAGNVKLEVKPLAREQHSDALFQNYSKNAQLNVRRAFRIPPIL